MPLSILHFPNPTLRYKAKPIVRVDAELKSLIDEMFDLMYEHRGVGLAATQVGLPLRFFIANPAGDKEEGQEYVFINPVISKPKGIEEAEEGCLSIPQLHANVKRSKTIQVSAFGPTGEPLDGVYDGFLARIIQHETDHLDGVLFIDRVSDGVRKTMERQLDEFTTIYESKLQTSELPSQADAQKLLGDWEAKYC